MKKIYEEALDAGLVPYVATSDYLRPHLDLGALGSHAVVKLLEDPKERNFHEAYLVSNSLAFGNPDLKMPNWVYIDCVLMQSAVVGFAVPVKKAPAALVEFYERDPYVDVNTLDYIPVSGQIAALGMDRKTLVGFSLFSLRRQLPDNAIANLAARTKYIALQAYRAEEMNRFVGISQYDNKALQIHALFGEKMYIDRTTMPLHPLRDMSFTYSMKVRLDADRIMAEIPEKPEKYDFLLRADDTNAKNQMQNDIGNGKKFHIAAPIHIKKDDGLYLPVCVEEK